MKKDQRFLCPSARNTPQAELFGVVGKERKTDYLQSPMPLGKEISDQISSMPDGDRRFRFTAPCVQGSCSKWSNGTCQLASSAEGAGGTAMLNETVPNCAIRDRCQWFAQESENACKVCKFVVRDLSYYPEKPSTLEF